MLKKLLNMSFSFSLSKLILKSPAIMISLLQLSNLDIVGVNSSKIYLNLHFAFSEIGISNSKRLR